MSKKKKTERKLKNIKVKKDGNKISLKNKKNIILK